MATRRHEVLLVARRPTRLCSLILLLRGLPVIGVVANDIVSPEHVRSDGRRVVEVALLEVPFLT